MAKRFVESPYSLEERADVGDPNRRINTLLNHKITDLVNFINQQSEEIETIKNEKSELEKKLSSDLNTAELHRLQNTADILQLQQQIAEGNLVKANQAVEAINQGANPDATIKGLSQQISGETSNDEQLIAEDMPYEQRGYNGPMTQEEHFNNLFAPKPEKNFETLESTEKARIATQLEAQKIKRRQEELEHDPTWREDRIQKLYNEMSSAKAAGKPIPLEQHEEISRLHRLKAAYAGTAPQRAEQAKPSLNALGIENFGKASTEALPPYIHGTEGALHKLMQRAYKETISERPFYKEPRIAEFEPLQTEAQRQAFNVMQAPDLKALFAESAKGLKRATNARGYDEVNKYLSPSLEPLMELMKRRAQQEFDEQTAPAINSDFIAKGAYRSGARQKAIERAKEKMNQNLVDSRTQLFSNAYNTAMGSSLEDLKRQSLNAAQMQELKVGEHENRVKNVNLLDEIGKRKQTLEQEKLNRRYNDWVEQQEYPMRATNRFSEIIHGLPQQTKIFDTAGNAQQPNPNFFSTLGGTALGIGAYNAKNPLQGLYKGGRVKKADGGQIDDYEARLKLVRDSLDKPKSSKIWDFIENMGMGIAASKSPTTMGAIQEGLPAGLMGMKQAHIDDESRSDKALSLSALLEKSRMDKASFDLERRFKEAQMGQFGKPKILEDRTADAMGNIVIGRKVNGIYTHLNGMPVKDGVVQQGMTASDGDSSQSTNTTRIPGSSPVEQKLNIEAQAETDKKEADLMSTINEGANIISTAKALSKEIPNPLYQDLTKVGGAIKNAVGEESKSLSNLETYTGTISETIGPLLQKLRGLGAMSEMEFKAATGLLATADKQPTARDNLLNIVDASLQRSKSQINARHAYKAETGSDKGFDRVWMNYVSTHPAYNYDPASGKVKVNHQNIDDWQSIFQKDVAAPAIGSMVGDNQVMTSKGPRSIEELKMAAARQE